jgi:hypothetical protein
MSRGEIAIWNRSQRVAVFVADITSLKFNVTYEIATQLASRARLREPYFRFLNLQRAVDAGGRTMSDAGAFIY